MKNILEQGLDRREYLTVEDIKVKFARTSSWQIRFYLKKLKIEPIGALPGFQKNGARKTGKGFLVYNCEATEKIRRHVDALIDVAAIKKRAKDMLREFE